MKKFTLQKSKFILAALLVLVSTVAQAADPVPAVKTYYVGTRGTVLPYTYVDEKNHLTGFDIELLREIDKRLEDVAFEFKTMSLESCFVSLEAKQIDIVANQLAHNADRDSKYAFTEIPYSYVQTMITVRGDENGIKTLDDLKGRSAAVTPTSVAARVVNKFNETADPKITLIISDNGSAETLNLLATGRVDATFSFPVTVKTTVEAMGYDIKVAGDPIASTPTHFILRQDDESRALIKKLDATLQELKDDGTLSKLSIDILGGDYTKAQ